MRSTYQGSLRETWLPLCQQPLIASGSSCERALCLPPLFTLEFLAGSVLCRSCAGYHNCCEFLCTIALLIPENNIPLQTSNTAGSYNHPPLSSSMIPELWEKCDIDVPFMAEYSPVTLVYLVGICVNYHLLQKEASLVRDERCINLRIQR